MRANSIFSVGDSNGEVREETVDNVGVIFLSLRKGARRRDLSGAATADHFCLRTADRGGVACSPAGAHGPRARVGALKGPTSPVRPRELIGLEHWAVHSSKSSRAFGSSAGA